MFINYPNNPTGAVVPDGFFEMVVSFAREHEILVVHDNAYSETTYDGYVAPSFLATPGAKEVGVEVFSLSKGFNMTGWRCAAILGNAEAVQTYWRLKTNVDSGLFEAVQMAGVAALQGPSGPLQRMNATYIRRRDLVVGALREIGVEVERAEGDDLRLGAGTGGPHLDLLRRAGAGRGRGRRLAGLDVRAQRRGLLPHLAHHARRPHHRGGRADARAPLLGASDLDFVDHALEGVGRAALAVGDEAEEHVAAGLQVECDQLAFAAFEHRGRLKAFFVEGRFAFRFEGLLDVLGRASPISGAASRWCGAHRCCRRRSRSCPRRADWL